MVKTTFRDNEEALEAAQKLWTGDGLFSDKSDFYRFARDFALKQIFDNYDPEYGDFDRKMGEIENIDGADIVMADTFDYFSAFDYAVSIKSILEDESVEPEQRIEKCLERTYQFLGNEFPETYVAEDLE